MFEGKNPRCFFLNRNSIFRSGNDERFIPKSFQESEKLFYRAHRFGGSMKERSRIDRMFFVIPGM
jgi:hypothetical protein